jgi:hypothetical protein
MMKPTEVDSMNRLRVEAVLQRNQARVEAAAYKWAYEYLQSRMESIDRHGWAHDCDGEIEARIECRVTD